MGLEEIKKVNVGEAVYAQMRNEILRGHWRSGAKLPSENQLMSMLGVSRGTVRQAMQKLAGEGLIETRQGEGSFVQVSSLDSFFHANAPVFSIGVDEMEKIFEFRAMLESGVAEIAATKATAAQIKKMERNYERMQGLAGDLEQYVGEDLNFHMLIGESTQNTLMVQIYNSYKILLHPSIQRMTEVIGPGNGLKYHGLILEAIRDHDPERARDVMHEHMVDNLDQFRKIRTMKDKLDELGSEPILVSVRAV